MSSTTTLGTSGQGGYLLPTGYLSTSGNQIVDASGNPVRIDSIGWNGPDGLGQLQGLYATSYQTIMNAIKADGFNTIRIPWSDVGLTAMPGSTTIDYSQNPDLAGLNTLQIFQKVVAYAGQIGLKIIFDHHTNDGSGGQQPNGLWFDSGPGTDGTDGNGTTGTVTAAKFQQDWVTLASTFKGNSTVIGFDLDNEPTSAGNINWGQGGPTDIQAMYTTVGNAVEAADPGALIIAEGPQEYKAPGAGSGMAANVAAPEGDLTGVATKPVTLNTPNKVVYSVHEYPSPISGIAADSGSALIQQMNGAWGYLETQNIAPVWIGEMGASLDGTADSAGSQLADEQAWAATLLGYMNGQDGGQGGPTFTGSQQPVSGDWWLAGSEAGQYPDGIQSAWGAGNYRPGQQAITNQMVFVPKAAPTTTPVTPSANDTVVKAGSTAAITDANGNKWTITSAGLVAVNGVADTTTASVTELAYVNGTIYQENTSNLWWGETQPNGSWAVSPGTAASPLPPPPSANDTVVKAGSTAAITDASGNKWTITSAGLVAVNGVADTTTASVTELAYVNGTIYQENTSNLWWGETQPNGSWAVSPGTATSPLPVVGSPDKLVLQMSEDAYNGDAQFTVKVNGVQIGATYSAIASHAAGQDNMLTLSGYFGAVPTVAVTFTNDLYGGPGLDRNLYVDGIVYDGAAQAASALIYKTGTTTFNLPAPASDTLTLKMSEDAYQGDAQFNVMVNGVQVGGTYSATASHSASQDTMLNLSGNFGGAPTVVVTFINDAWAGTGQDRNLYVDGITYDGVAQTASANLYSNGPAAFALHGTAKSAAPSATMTLTDNKSATAKLAVITSGSQVSYGNGAQTSLDGTVRQAVDSTGVVNISTDGFNNGPVSFGVVDKGGASYHVSNFATSNVEVAGATAGSVTVDGAAGGVIKVDSGTYAVSIAAEALTSGSTAQNRMSVALLGSGNDSLLIDDSATSGMASNVVTLGSGNDTMRFIAASASNVNGGSGFDTAVTATGTNLFTAGTGTFDVTGGTGTNGYVYHTGGGLLEIEDFALSKSNYVTIDKSLQTSMTQASDGHGGVMMTLGATGHGIDFVGVTNVPTGQISYV